MRPASVLSGILLDAEAGQGGDVILPMPRAEDEADEEGDERRADGDADGADAEEDEAADAAPSGDGAAEEPLPDAAQPEEAAEPVGTSVLTCCRAS